MLVDGLIMVSIFNDPPGEPLVCTVLLGGCNTGVKPLVHAGYCLIYINVACVAYGYVLSKVLAAEPIGPFLVCLNEAFIARFPPTRPRLKATLNLIISSNERLVVDAAEVPELVTLLKLPWTA